MEILSKLINEIAEQEEARIIRKLIDEVAEQMEIDSAWDNPYPVLPREKE